MNLAPKPPATPKADSRDLWARWPDDFMCPLGEVEEMLSPPCARSDDYQVIEIMEYGGDGTPTRWARAD